MKGDTTFNDYKRALTRLRYRNGKRDGYTSRLHYFSDWIRDKQVMGITTEIQMPNPPFTALQTVKVSYMSNHPDSYKALKANPELVKVIASQEKALSGITARYIPKSQVSNTKVMRDAVKDGDIIAITCSNLVLTLPILDLPSGRVMVFTCSTRHNCTRRLFLNQ